MEDIDYFVSKPGRIRNQNKRNKFGNVARSGATLRRNNHTNSSSLCGGRKHNSVILKHVSVTDDWTAQDVENHFDFDDGGLVKGPTTKVPTARGKRVKSAIAQRNSGKIIYSMNKKKRWLLPDMLQREIEGSTESENKERDIDMIVIERELQTSVHQYGPYDTAPDTVRVSSTMKSRDDNVIGGGKRKYKRRKYGWSTDLLGLSQKRSDSDQENSEESVKPQVTYEVCRPRPQGKQPRHNQTSSKFCYQGYDRKFRRSAKREFHLVSREYNDTYSTQNNSPQESNDTNEDQNVTEQRSCSIHSWLQVSEKSRPLKPLKKTNELQTVDNSHCLKDRLVYETVSRKTMENETNKRNSAEVLAAESYLDEILNQEEDSSVEVNVSLASLNDLDCRFPGPFGLQNETAECKFHGVTVTRGCSRPIKYVFQMQNHISTQCPVSGEISIALVYLTLESVSDPHKCKNRNTCYDEVNFCHCHEYLPMRLKTVVLSENEGHQQSRAEWNEKLTTILRRPRLGCSGTYIEKIIKIATNTLKNCTTFDSNKEVENERKTIISTTAISSYHRKVIDEVTAMAGFPTTQQCKEGLVKELKSSADQNSAAELTDNYETEVIIENCTPTDFCEICCVVLCEEDKAFRASAMAECKHWFCTDCWRQHAASLARMASAPQITCPAYACKTKVDDVTLMTLLPGDVMSRYQSRQLNFAVKRSVELYHCPSCNEVVKIQSPKKNTCLTLSCVCGARWCSKCEQTPHWPATCEVAQLYWKKLEKERNALEQALITSVDGRKCPQCHEPMEKDGGCQMMTCVCGYSFCWKCLKSFDECLYNCRTKVLDLSTWKLDTPDDKFVGAVRQAVSCSNNYQSFKQHKFRSKMCRSVAYKIGTSSPEQETNLSYSEKLNAAEEAEKELMKMLLFCDGLQHIIQYLVLEIACLKGNKRNQRAKMNGVLSRLQLLSTNLERNILVYNARKCTHLEALKQHFKQQAIPAKKSVQFLKSLLDNCNAC